ncbi:hypothetical protein GCM10020229_26880 [Kitasatospora albolonga]
MLTRGGWAEGSKVPQRPIQRDRAFPCAEDTGARVLTIREDGVPAGTRSCPPEFWADTVVLSRWCPGATVSAVAADPGVRLKTPQSWIRKADRLGAKRERARPATAEGGEEVARPRDFRRAQAPLRRAE